MKFGHTYSCYHWHKLGVGFVFWNWLVGLPNNFSLDRYLYITWGISKADTSSAKKEFGAKSKYLAYHADLAFIRSHFQ